jgi:hypothetical protein
MATPCYQNILYGPSVDVEYADLNHTLNVVLPTTGKPKLRMETIYADDGVQVAYYEYTLTVDTVIYSENQVLNDMEAEVTRIREILGTPGLMLSMHPVGLGELPIVNSDEIDIKGGPFPQEVVVEPIASNKAIYVKWTVITRLSTCPDISGPPGLIQFTSELDFDVDDEGDLTFNYRFTYQHASPITDVGFFNNYARILGVDLSKSYQGMQRKKRVSFSRDQRIAKVHITFTDIKSDNAYFPRTHNIDVTDELSSDLLSKNTLSGAGFYTWNRRISGTITLPQRVHKSWAWIVFLRILRSRFYRLYPTTKIAAILDATAPTNQEDEPEDKTTDFYLLHKIRITNPIYTRTMKFDVEYVVVTNLANLIDNTKIFSRVNTAFEDCPEVSEPLTLSEQWRLWDAAKDLTKNVDGVFAYNVSGAPVVFNQCTGDASEVSFISGRLLSNENDPDYPENDGASSFADPCEQGYNLDEAPFPDRMGLHSTPSMQAAAKNSWLDYNNEFEILEKANNLQVSFLTNPGANYYKTTQTQAATTNRGSTQMTLDGKTSDPASSVLVKSITIPRGVSRYQLRMKGYAMRAGYKIPIPSVVTVAGASVSKTGQPRIKHVQLVKGDAPVYLAMWDIIYNVDTDIHSADVIASIVTSGVAGHYT